jgi:hypothetical protein
MKLDESLKDYKGNQQVAKKQQYQPQFGAMVPGLVVALALGLGLKT